MAGSERAVLTPTSVVLMEAFETFDLSRGAWDVSNGNTHNWSASFLAWLGDPDQSACTIDICRDTLREAYRGVVALGNELAVAEAYVRAVRALVALTGGQVHPISLEGPSRPTWTAIAAACARPADALVLGLSEKFPCRPWPVSEEPVTMRMQLVDAHHAAVLVAGSLKNITPPGRVRR